MKYALFDCDGTLMDSMEMWVNLASDVLKRYGVDLPREVERETASMSHKDAAIFYADKFLNGEKAEELERTFTEVLEENYREKLTLKPHVADVLQKLSEQKIPMAVASSTDENLLLLGLERLGLLPYFQFVQTVDNTGFSKNSDDYFKLVCEKFGCKPEDILFFDDALYALERAKKNGLVLVGVQDDTNTDHEEAIRQVSDYYINDFSEIDIDTWFQ